MIQSDSDIDASIIANFFLKKAFDERMPLSPMKLLKLVYIAHGWSLAILGEDLLNGERVEAWPHGPVIPSLYHEFKRFKNQSIEKGCYSERLKPVAKDQLDALLPLFLTDIKWEKQKDLIEILDTVWKSYKEYSAWGLSEKTHEEHSPWQQTINKKEKFIENNLIQSYYHNFLEKLLSDE